jgi:hypothetical protein
MLHAKENPRPAERHTDQGRRMEENRRRVLIATAEGADATSKRPRIRLPNAGAEAEFAVRQNVVPGRIRNWADSIY